MRTAAATLDKEIILKINFVTFLEPYSPSLNNVKCVKIQILINTIEMREAHPQTLFLTDNSVHVAQIKNFRKQTAIFI